MPLWHNKECTETAIENLSHVKFTSVVICTVHCINNPANVKYKSSAILRDKIMKY